MTTRLWVVVASALVLAACSGHSKKSEPSDVIPSTLAPTTIPTGSSTTVPVPTTRSKPGYRNSYQLPTTVAADCSSDVTPQMQAWINGIPDDSYLSLGSKACYRVDGTITMQNRHHLQLNGNDAVLKPATTGDLKRIGVAILGGSDIKVVHLTVWGANPTAGARPDAYHPSLVGQHGFKVGGATDVVLDHVSAFDVYGDFVYVGGFDGKPSSQVMVSTSTFARSGRQGITIVDADHVTIQENVISGVAMTMFDIEPNLPTQEARSIHIIGNVTGSARAFWFANEGAHADVGDIEISGNRMKVATGGLIFVYASSGPYRSTYVITDNQFIANYKVADQHSKGALFFTHAQNVTITGNHVTFPKGHDMPAIELRDSRHVTVRGNTFANAGSPLLATEGSADYHIG